MLGCWESTSFIRTCSDCNVISPGQYQPQNH